MRLLCSVAGIEEKLWAVINVQLCDGFCDLGLESSARLAFFIDCKTRNLESLFRMREALHVLGVEIGSLNRL